MTTTVRESLFVVPAIAAIARNLGFFAAAGLEVADVMTPSSTAQRADLDSGRVDVAITSTDNLFAWNTSGSDMVLIGQIEKTTDQVLMTKPGLPSLTEASRPPARRRRLWQRLRHPCVRDAAPPRVSGRELRGG